MRGLISDIKYNRYIYLMLLPGVALLFIFNYIPIYGILLAFKDFHPLKGIAGSAWVGFEHFEKMFGSMFFWRVLRNTLILNVYGLIFAFPAPIILALLLNELRSKAFCRTIQTITYLPHFISWVIIGGFIINILSPYQGIPAIIGNITGAKIDIFPLIEPRFIRSIAVASGIWKEAGWGSIIFLAAIAGINLELYDSAIVDGAGRWKQTIHITIPSIMPTIMVMLVLRFGAMLSSNFEQMYMLLTPTTMVTGDVIATYVFREGIGKGNFSFNTAVGLFQSGIGALLLLTVSRVVKRLGYSMW